MIKQFLSYIDLEKIFSIEEDRILLAISAGVDSVVLANLLKAAGVDFAMAHCNFKLRGEASDEDEAFVRILAEKLQVPFYFTLFETEKIVEERKSSIQMVARDLRYQWLEEIRKKQGYDYIATAHHINDSIESLLLNLTKGCGIRGIHGILPRTESTKRIRPLLFASKEELLAFSTQEKIAYREDGSNASTKYTRNHIRHLVVPQLKSINPSLETTFFENFQAFRDAEWLYDFAIEKIKLELLEPARSKGALWSIAIEKLLKLPVAKSLLYEILAPYGFTGRQVRQMIEHIEGSSGAVYYTEKYRLLRSYGYLLLEPSEISDNNKTYQFLEKLPTVDASILFDLGDEFSLQASLLSFSEFEQASKNDRIAYFDADLLSLPLSIRSWTEGDRFQPFGMKGQHKKLSSLFKDLKLSVFERAKTKVLMSEHNIVWVLGLRSDEKFKVRPSTKKVLQIILTNHQ